MLSLGTGYCMTGVCFPDIVDRPNSTSYRALRIFVYRRLLGVLSYVLSTRYVSAGGTRNRITRTTGVSLLFTIQALVLAAYQCCSCLVLAYFGVTTYYHSLGTTSTVLDTRGEGGGACYSRTSAGRFVFFRHGCQNAFVSASNCCVSTFIHSGEP